VPLAHELAVLVRVRLGLDKVTGVGAHRGPALAVVPLAPLLRDARGFVKVVTLANVLAVLESLRRVVERGALAAGGRVVIGVVGDGLHGLLGRAPFAAFGLGFAAAEVMRGGNLTRRNLLRRNLDSLRLLLGGPGGLLGGLLGGTMASLGRGGRDLRRGLLRRGLLRGRINLSRRLATSVELLRLPSELELESLDLGVLGPHLLGHVLHLRVGVGQPLDVRGVRLGGAGVRDDVDVARVDLLDEVGIGFGRVRGIIGRSLRRDARTRRGRAVLGLVRVLPGVLVLGILGEGLRADGGDRGSAAEHRGGPSEAREHRGRGVAASRRDGRHGDDAGDHGDGAEAAEGPRQRAGALGGRVRLEESLLLGREQRASLVRGRGRRGRDDAAGKHPRRWLDETPRKSRACVCDRSAPSSANAGAVCELPLELTRVLARAPVPARSS